MIELWEYAVGGGLIDPVHFDENSVLTFVTLLSAEDLTGGDLRTHEVDGSHRVHRYKLGLILTRNFHNLTRIFTPGINWV